MSSSEAKEERQKRRTLVLRPSSRITNISGVHGVHHSTRHTGSVVGSPSRRSFSLGGGSKVLEKSVSHTPRQAVRVFDSEDNDVTPVLLYQADPAAVQGKVSRFFLDELSAGSASDQTAATGSFSMPFSRSLLASSRISSQSTIESINEEMEDVFSKKDLPINLPDLQGKRDAVEEHVTEDMLKELVDVYISETDSVSLLDIPSTLVSVDADDADAIMERNNQYAELCRHRMGNDKYVDRSMQTTSGAAKNKLVQSNGVGTVDTATTVTTWDMYDTLISPQQDETACHPEPDKADYAEAVVEPSKGTEKNSPLASTTSTGNTSATSSLKEMEAFWNNLNTESDMQLIMQSEKFQHSLQVLERSLLGNIFQSKMAAYRQLPILGDPDSPVEQREEDSDGDRPPAMEHLWAFSCELNRGRSVSSMAWNKKNPDLLAVGYGQHESSDHKPGLVCCWSLKNPTWPERFFHCDSPVTSLDFSSNSPSQLAVGMHNGGIAIFNVQNQANKSCMISTSEYPNRHLGPVWQLRWVQQEFGVSEKEKVEALFSVAADGRVCKWFVCNTGLNCTELMKLKKIQMAKKKAGGNKTEQASENVLSALTPGLCFDFHSTDSSIYLVGTWEGFIHKCSLTNTQQFLDTYKKHFHSVNCIAWCPLCPDVFLSCSSDWTIQLWRQDHLNPVLGFTSTRRAVCDIKWSPRWSTVFGVVHEGQLEIWDLNSSILDPVIVQPAGPGVQMKTLQFAPQTDCVLVGDSEGQVTVYLLKNLNVNESIQADSLEVIINSAAR